METKDYFMQLQEELQQTHELCENGELSNLDALIKMRNAKAQAESILETVKKFEDDRLNEISNEAEKYGGKYCGYEIKAVNGRKGFNFKGIEEIEAKDTEKKQLEEKYKSAFDGFQKGTVQTTEVDGVRYWIDTDGELKPFPELTIGKSYLTVKQSK